MNCKNKPYIGGMASISGALTAVVIVAMTLALSGPFKLSAEPLSTIIEIETIDGTKAATDVYHYVDASGIEGLVFGVEGELTWYSDIHTGLETSVEGVEFPAIIVEKKSRECRPKRPPDIALAGCSGGKALVVAIVLAVGFASGLIVTRQRTVENKAPKASANRSYVVQWNPLNWPAKQAFTPNQVGVAGDRAKKNPEDF